MQSLAQEVPRSPIYGHRCYNKKASIFICSASCTVFLSIQSRALRVLEDCYYPSLMLLVQACLQWVFYCPTWKLYWGSRHCPHCAVQPRERTPKQTEKNCIALERNIAALGMSGVARLGGVARLPRWLHGTAGLSIPLGEHGMPSGSDSIADHRTSMQSQPAASILVVVVWCSQPGDPHHWRQETAQEERSSPAAEPGEAARDSCQMVRWEGTLWGCGEVCVQVGGNMCCWVRVDQYYLTETSYKHLKSLVNISKQASPSLQALTSSNLFWFSKSSDAGLLAFEINLRCAEEKSYQIQNNLLQSCCWSGEPAMRQGRQKTRWNEQETKERVKRKRN